MTAHFRRAPALLLLAAVASASRADSVVYSNLTNSNGTLISVGNDGSQIGDEITLAPGPRMLTRLDVGLRTSFSTTADFEARIYVPDGLGGQPGTLLWDSGIVQNVAIGFTPRIVSFVIPNVPVPDTVIWTIAATDSQFTPLLGGYSPPTIGQDTPSVWLNVGSGWVSQTEDYRSFGAAITAIPEPCSALLLAIAGVLVRARRCGRAQAPGTCE